MSIETNDTVDDNAAQPQATYLNVTVLTFNMSYWERFVPENIRHQLMPPVTVDEGTSQTRWRVRSTLDLYARVSLNSPPRLRVKHTLFPARFVALKSQLSLGRGSPPEVEAELKLLGVFKYTLSRSGPSAQLRVKAPLALDNATMDVVYERRPNWGDDVRVAFRFRDALSIKVPYPLTSLKARRRLLPNLKTTLRIKRALEPLPSRSQFYYGSGRLAGNPENSREAQRNGANRTFFIDLSRLATVLLNDRPSERRRVEHQNPSWGAGKTRLKQLVTSYKASSRRMTSELMSNTAVSRLNFQ